MKRPIFIFGTLTLLLLAVLAMFVVLGRHRPVELVDVPRVPSGSNVCLRHVARKVDSVKVDSAPVSSSAAVVVICGRDASTACRYEARNNALRSIARRRDLPMEDVASLMAYLASTNDTLRVERVAALKNDVMNLLRNQEPLVDGLLETLMAMFNGGSHPSAVLDYCIQHLGAMLGDLDGAKRSVVCGMLIKAARQHAQPYAGTALYSLAGDTHVTSAQQSEYKRLVIALCKPECNLIARIAAIQLAGQLNCKEVLPLLRKSLSAPSCDAVLDIVCIGSVGLMGDAGDLGLLYRFLSDRRRASAAETAISRIKERLDLK